MKKTTAAQKVILVVDDDLDTAQSMATLLEVLGHTAEFVTDARSVVDAARRLQPHLVFLDIRMPGVNGWDVARTLRQQIADERLRLVAVSGHAAEQDHRRSREAGFDAHVAKPVDMQLLQSILAQVG